MLLTGSPPRANRSAGVFICRHETGAMMHGDLLAPKPPTDARLFIAKVFELRYTVSLCLMLRHLFLDPSDLRRAQASCRYIQSIPSHIRAFSTHVSYPLYPLLTLHCTVVLVDLAP